MPAESVVIITEDGEFPVDLELDEEPADEQDRLTAVTEAAIRWCSNHGHSYSTWERLPQEAETARTLQADVRDGKPEDDVSLWCKYCQWCGSGAEAGWDEQDEEWTCPQCGGAEYLRVVDEEESHAFLSR